METINETSFTITLDHVKLSDTIGDLIKKARLQGRKFKISITVEEPIISEKTTHPLADYLENNHPFSGLSETMNRATKEIREGMSEKLFDKFAK